jgi:hypothetical protein
MCLLCHKEEIQRWSRGVQKWQLGHEMQTHLVAPNLCGLRLGRSVDEVMLGRSIQVHILGIITWGSISF